MKTTGSCCGISNNVFVLGKRCPDLHQEPNMISPTKLTGYVFQDQVAFQCAEGYSLSSAEKLTCLARSQLYIGLWSRNQPSCLRKYQIYFLLAYHFSFINS